MGHDLDVCRIDHFALFGRDAAQEFLWSWDCSERARCFAAVCFSGRTRRRTDGYARYVDRFSDFDYARIGWRACWRWSDCGWNERQLRYARHVVLSAFARESAACGSARSGELRRGARAQSEAWSAERMVCLR